MQLWTPATKSLFTRRPRLGAVYYSLLGVGITAWSVFLLKTGASVGAWMFGMFLGAVYFALAGLCFLGEQAVGDDRPCSCPLRVVPQFRNSTVPSQ